MKILAIDSSSVSASAALLEDDRLLGEQFTNVQLTHSQTLMPMVEEILKNTKTDVASVDVFAVTTGPGSFTGVRIGVSATKGLADAADKPCFGVSALEAAAYPFHSFQGIVCAAMDARCNQVYTALFQNGVRLTEDLAIQIAELGVLLAKYDLPVLLAGDGAQKVTDALSEKTGLSLILADPLLRYTRASSAAFLAMEKLQNGEQTVTPSALSPMYLRLPQAQRELNNKNKEKNK